MTEEQSNRLKALADVLNYTSEFGYGKTALLTTGERMLIHQERAYLLNQTNELELRTIREYKVPEQLDKKIQSIIKLINQ